MRVLSTGLAAIFVLSFLGIQDFARANDKTTLAGVWKGHIGSNDIVACFGRESKSGSYYYVKFKKPIPLSQQDKNKEEWDEYNGVWIFKTLEAKQINGIWRNPQSGKTLTLELRLDSNNGNKDSCASDEFNSPLENMPQIETGEIENFLNKKYRVLSMDNQVKIQLLTPSDAATKKINDALRDEFPKSIKDLGDDYFADRRALIKTYGTADDEINAKPVYWSSKFIVINFYDWAVGFGRMGISSINRAWDMQTGKEISLWQWFDNKALLIDNKNTVEGDSEEYRRLPVRLNKYLIKQNIVTKECKDEQYMDKGLFNITLEKTVITFAEEAFGNGCEISFDIPYTKLDPFLTNKGKLAVQSIINDTSRT